MGILGKMEEYIVEEDSWERETNLKNVKEVMKEYEKEYEREGRKIEEGWEEQNLFSDGLDEGS